LDVPASVVSAGSEYWLEQDINGETLRPRKKLGVVLRSLLADKAVTANYAASATTANYAATSGDSHTHGNKSTLEAIANHSGASDGTVLTKQGSSLVWQASSGGGGGGTFTQVTETLNQNDEVIITHPAVTGERIVVSVLELVPAGGSGTHTVGFTDGGEFVQEDASSGTNFENNSLILHFIGENPFGSNDQYTVLLLHGEDLLKDDSKGGADHSNDIQNIGSVHNNHDSMPNFGKAIYFNGSNQLNITSHADFALGNEILP
ncbi:MAG: hypothetical protein OMM_14662, partial [Candidatus Magnetoglobus multicellularis str. Araruama]